MLAELLKDGFGLDMDLNCAETILYGANKAYNLGLDKEAFKLSAAFGGGMSVEDRCGALTGSMMVLGKIFIEDRAHESTRIKTITRELRSRLEAEMGKMDCIPLKEKYRTEREGCRQILIMTAEILDQIIIDNEGNE
jgi:C_GCAxxG_C_C family probable redox protein